MSQNGILNHIETWQTRLGLLPIPLFAHAGSERRFVLLNGSQGNFCLGLDERPLGSQTRNEAWSANVGHYVSLGQGEVRVQRWDRSPTTIQRFPYSDVREDLERFHRYLERDAPAPGQSVVAHAIQVFRSLRNALGPQCSGERSLLAYLYLLAAEADDVERDDLQVDRWQLSPEAAETAEQISGNEWDALRNELRNGRTIEDLKPDLALVLRHASGQLFQEAHYAAHFYGAGQLDLGFLAPSPVSIRKVTSFSGVHFTPAALARTLVEEVLGISRPLPDSLTIFDPACGSGEFLREALRQLTLGYSPNR